MFGGYGDKTGDLEGRTDLNIKNSEHWLLNLHSLFPNYQDTCVLWSVKRKVKFYLMMTHFQGISGPI